MAWKGSHRVGGRARAAGLVAACVLVACTATALAAGKTTKYSGKTTPYNGSVSFKLSGGKISSFSFTAPLCTKERSSTKNYKSKPIPTFAVTGSNFSDSAPVTLASGPGGSQTATYKISGKLSKKAGKLKASGTITVLEKSVTSVGPFGFTSTCNFPASHFTATGK
jgi:hypothetical protein